jgi:hypothetical protein
MSAQRLSDRKTRWLSRQVGLDVVRAWAHGGYIYDFVVAADNPDRHRHGWYDKKTGEWGLHEWTGLQSHYDTCFTELFMPKVPLTTPADGTRRSG